MSHLGDDVAAWVDGELGDTGARRAADHLARCAQCRDAVAEERRIRTRLRLADDPAPSTDLSARLLAAACAARESHRPAPGDVLAGPGASPWPAGAVDGGRRRRLLVLAGCAAAGVLVGVAGLASVLATAERRVVPPGAGEAVLTGGTPTVGVPAPPADRRDAGIGTLSAVVLMTGSPEWPDRTGPGTGGPTPEPAGAVTDASHGG